MERLSWGPGSLASLLGPHPVDPVLSTLALGRLEFLSPWGGSVLCFHHAIFMVTWEWRETPVRLLLRLRWENGGMEGGEVWWLGRWPCGVQTIQGGTRLESMEASRQFRAGCRLSCRL